MRKKDKANLLKVGIFVSALTLILVIMIASIGKENSIFASKVDIRARVDNVANLKPGSYVELKGIRVGSVQYINILSDDVVEITFSMLESQVRWIKKDSKVAISNAGLVGDKYLEIINGTPESPIFDPNKDFLTSEGGANFKKIISKGESIAELTEKILNRMDQILENLNLGDSMGALNRTAKNMEAISKDLKDARMGDMVKNVNLTMSSLNKSTGSMERIMSQIEKGPGTMNSLIYDDILHEDLRAVLGGAQRNKVIKYFIRESIKNSEKKQQARD